MSVDGEKSCILIEDKEAPLEVQEKPEILSGPKDLPDSVIAAYAKSTGYSIIKLKALAGRAQMGDLVQKLGACKIGSSMLLESEEMIKEGIKIIDGMIDDYRHDPKAVSSLMRTRQAFTDLWVKASIAHIESRKEQPEGPSEKPQNVPPPPLMPVQINIHDKQVSIHEKPQ